MTGDKQRKLVCFKRWLLKKSLSGRVRTWSLAVEPLESTSVVSHVTAWGTSAVEQLQFAYALHLSRLLPHTPYVYSSRLIFCT